MRLVIVKCSAHESAKYEQNGVIDKSPSAHLIHVIITHLGGASLAGISGNKTGFIVTACHHYLNSGDLNVPSLPTCCSRRPLLRSRRYSVCLATFWTGDMPAGGRSVSLQAQSGNSSWESCKMSFLLSPKVYVSTSNGETSSRLALIWS